jgi:hypothetical protein
MTAGANKKFLEQREQFLTQNLIVIQNPQQYLSQKADLTDLKPLVFDLEHDPNSKFLDKNGVPVKTYLLRLMEIRKGYTFADNDEGIMTSQANKPRIGKYTHGILAYYLPWDNNRYYEAQLEDDADFMFTPTLDGCSFVIGSGKSPKVAHLNFQTNEGRVDQEKMNREIAKKFAEDQPTTLKLADYSPNSHEEKLKGKTTNLTVVGFRDRGTKTWSFYYQKRVQKYTKQLTIKQILTDRLVPIDGT